MIAIEALKHEWKSNIVLKGKEHVRYNSQTAIIQLPHFKYVDKVLRSNSYEELWERFKDAESPSKEISESYAAFSVMKKHCRINNFNWFHIGDGAYTRTAAIFAFCSKSMNWSIDPQLNIGKFKVWEKKFNVKNIIPLTVKFEMLDKTSISWIEPYNITCVHAHVNLEEVDKKFPYWVFLYTNPCCYPQSQTFSEEYMKENNIVKLRDEINLGILSKRRRVVVYYKNKLT